MRHFTRVTFMQWRNELTAAVNAIKNGDTKSAINVLERSFSNTLNVEAALERVRSENEKMMATDYWCDRNKISTARIAELESQLRDAKADYDFLWKMRLQDEKERSEKK